MLYVGIDPGLTGAWGMIDHHGCYWSCGDMHHNEDGILDTERIWDEMCQAKDGMDTKVFIEKVHSMPKQGVSSTFKFGMAFGGALSLARRFKTEMVMVTPQLWKKTLVLNSDKQQSLDMAREIFPQAPLHLKKHNGRAEALLIALYGFKND